MRMEFAALISVEAKISWLCIIYVVIIKCGVCGRDTSLYINSRRIGEELVVSRQIEVRLC